VGEKPDAAARSFFLASAVSAELRGRLAPQQAMGGIRRERGSSPTLDGAPWVTRDYEKSLTNTA